MTADLHGGGIEGDDGVDMSKSRDLCTTWTHFKHFLLLGSFTASTRLDREYHVTRDLDHTALTHTTVTQLCNTSI